jgi:hypothetical protein
MASLPLARRSARAETYFISPQLLENIMELAGLLFFVLLGLAAALGLTADSRDSADWKQTADGARARRSY